MSYQTTQTGKPLDFDFGPAFKMYVESLESWKDSYEKLLQNAPLPPSSHAAAGTNPAIEQAMANWQHSGQTLFKRFIRQQIELCRFFEKRLETYVDFPEQLARCKTPAEVAQLEFSFLNRMATEYAQESAKLMEPMSEMMASWASGRPTT